MSLEPVAPGSEPGSERESLRECFRRQLQSARDDTAGIILLAWMAHGDLPKPDLAGIYKEVFPDE